MWIAIGITAAVLLFLILLVLLVRWKITVRCQKQAVRVYVGRLCVFRSDKSRKKDREEEKYIKIPKLTLSDLKHRTQTVRELYRDEKHEVISLLQELERRITVERLDISLVYGFGDAAVTGVASSILWSAMTGFLQWLGRYVAIEGKTNAALSPEYTTACFDLNALLILRVRVSGLRGVWGRARQLYKRNKTRLLGLKI